MYIYIFLTDHTDLVLRFMVTKNVLLVNCIDGLSLARKYVVYFIEQFVICAFVELTIKWTFYLIITQQYKAVFHYWAIKLRNIKWLHIGMSWFEINQQCFFGIETVLHVCGIICKYSLRHYAIVRIDKWWISIFVHKMSMCLVIPLSAAS